MNPSGLPAIRPPCGLTAVGIFLLFGALMASFAGVTLLWRGTLLDRMWALNPRAYRELATHGEIFGISFVLLGITLAIVGVAWFKRRVWGWGMAVSIIATQVLGDLVNALTGDVVRGLVGLIIAGALLVYLLSGRVRAAFVSRVSD